MPELQLTDDKKKEILKAASKSKKVREILPALGIDLEELKKEVRGAAPEMLSDEEIKERLISRLNRVENPERIADYDRYTFWIWNSALNDGSGRIVIAQLVGASAVPVKALSIPVEIAQSVADAILRRVGNRRKKR